MNGFDDLMLLLRLVGDPEAHRARLVELQAAIDTAAAKEADARAAHAELEGERQRLGKLEAGLREREINVFLGEQKHEGDLAKMRTWLLEHAPNRRTVAVGPGGLTREIDDTVIAPDPIDDRFAEPMELEPIGPRAAQVGHTRSLRRIRV